MTIDKKNKYFASLVIICLLCLSPAYLCSGQDREVQRARVYPSHISFTVDDETFSELQDSRFLLDEFANTVIKTLTVDSGLTWTGVYIYGRNTYLEFYEDEEDWPVGSCSIAFDVAKEGELKNFKDFFEKQLGISAGKIELRTIKTGELESPWFYYLDLYEAIGCDTFSPWVLEWHPDSIAQYFNRPITELVDEHGLRYDDPSFSADRMFNNVIEINVPMRRSEMEKWTRFLSAIGFRRSNHGNDVRFSRRDLTFNFLIDSRTSILELKMSLLEGHQSCVEEYSFGERLRLKFNGDGTASLFFRQD